MRYPENLKIGDTIGICAPSAGIIDEYKIQRLDAAEEQLRQIGYKVIETESVRKDKKGRSTTGEQRAKELMQLLENDEVKLIIYASGGDFLIDMLDYLDWDKLRTLKPKWTQGYSDITTISFLFNTILDVSSIYSQNVKDYAMQPLHKSLTDALKIASGKKVVQHSFEKYEKESEETTNPNATYNLTEKVEWRNITGEQKIQMQGRAIGGCLDCIKNFFRYKV